MALILITGGSSGIGKASAIQLAQQGHEIIIQARNLEKLKTAAAEIQAVSKSKVHYYSTDLINPKKVEAAAQQIVNEIGLPEVVINSAGAGEWLSLKEATIEYYGESMASPYLATAYSCKAFYDLMQKRGTGHFIIVNSAACYFAFPAATGYTAARWAMLGFAKTLQADLYSSKFKVSMVALGKVTSPYFTNNPKSEERIPKIVDILVPTMSEEVSGKIIANTVRSKRKTVIKPMIMAFFVCCNRFIPGFFSWLMRRTAYKG